MGDENQNQNQNQKNACVTPDRPVCHVTIEDVSRQLREQRRAARAGRRAALFSQRRNRVVGLPSRLRPRRLDFGSEPGGRPTNRKRKKPGTPCKPPINVWPRTDKEDPDQGAPMLVCPV